MPLLSRTRTKLLWTVNGKSHATQNDHIEQVPTPPPSNSTRASVKMEEDEDFARSPDPSDDEGVGASAIKFQTPRQVDGVEDEVVDTPTFKQPHSLPPKSSGSKRSNDSDVPSSEGDEIFSSQTSSNKRLKSNFSPPRNIFAPVRPSRRAQQFGKEAQRRRERANVKGAKKENVKPKVKEENATVFKEARGAGMFDSDEPSPEPQFQTRRRSLDNTTRRSNSLSPSLSSLSSEHEPPDVEEVKKLRLPTAVPHEPKAECAICGVQLDLLLKQEFEDLYMGGGGMVNYKWQQRFCRWHRQREAESLAAERKYPAIDWEGLEGRMRRFHKHLIDVMAGRKASFHRERLGERVKERAKTAMQVLSNDGGKRGGCVGYYGPRGERLMTDHIISHLSDQLRKQSSKDKLVAAAGVSGGVSGFVQAVLVPELAEQLVMEDLNVSTERAREVIAESAEVGELLYPNVDDKVGEDVEMEVI